jgi:hypothetical protein
MMEAAPAAQGKRPETVKTAFIGDTTVAGRSRNAGFLSLRERETYANGQTLHALPGRSDASQPHEPRAAPAG